MNSVIKSRVTSIDFLRGTAMIIMALDHVRDYLYAGSFLFDPLDLGKTSGILFFTRWITHFCAPVFLLLAGTSAYLVGLKKSKSRLSVFLLKRGVWLIFLELVVVNFGWNFNLRFPVVLLITIWALGVSMIVLAGLVYLPKWLILSFSLLLIAGHDLFDNFHVAGTGLSAFSWALLHEQKAFVWHNEIFLVGYPLIPLIAIMPLGYCTGMLYAPDYDPGKREKTLLALGLTALLLFAIIRYSNVYGDPVKWSIQKSSLFTTLSFLNVSKYPPSFLYTLLTLGSALVFLGLTEKLNNGAVKFVSVYGRVPMFYYIIHIYIIHLVAMLASFLLPGQSWEIWILTKPIWFTAGLKGYGFSLMLVYIFWISLVLALFPLCKRFDRFKQENKDRWWLSYL